MQKTIEFFFLPLFLGFNAAAIWLMGEGYSPWWLAVLFGTALIMSFWGEKLAPYNPAFNQNMGDRNRDIWHALVNEGSALANTLSVPALIILLGTADLWPGTYPFWLQCLGAVLFADLGVTFAHFASHKWSWLWRFHAVHHSVKRMYGFNGLMKHPVHQAIEGLVGVAPLIALGMPLDVGLVLLFMIATQLLLQHSNIGYRVGPLRWVLAVNQVHRFHHLKWANLGDVNFGLLTTLGDHILGTYHFEAEKTFSPDDLGIGTDPDYPQTYLKQLAAPFMKRPVQVSPKNSSETT